MQRIKEYLIFHIKDSKEQRELLDYLDQLQQKEKLQGVMLCSSKLLEILDKER